MQESCHDRRTLAACNIGAERKPLTPAAQRALAEAEERRQTAEANATPAPEGIAGSEGPGTDTLRRLGEARASPRIFERDWIDLPARRQLSGTLVGNMSPYRQNKYLSEGRYRGCLGAAGSRRR